MHWTRPVHLSQGYMGARLEVDGTTASGIVMREGEAPSTIYSSKGFVTSTTTIRPYLFGSMNFTGACVSTVLRLKTKLIPGKIQTTMLFWISCHRQDLEVLG